MRSGSASGTMFLQDHAGLLCVGTLTPVALYQTSFGGNSCFKNELRVLGAVTFDSTLLVKGVTLSSSDSRIKEDVQPIDQNLCVEIIKSVEPKSYKRTDQINNTQREIGFIAQDLLDKLSDNMQNLVQEVPDETFQTIYAVDYGRLTTILWGVCKNQIKRIEILENK